MADSHEEQRLRAISGALSIGRLQRHIFFCADQTKPKCAPREETIRLWKYLKSRLTELGLSSSAPKWRGKIDGPPPPTPEGDGCVFRSKVDCLRVCESGPIAVVYPEGAWYRGLDEHAIDEIIEQHLIGGKPVRRYLFAISPLSGGET